jgi:hypothetical protein
MELRYRKWLHLPEVRCGGLSAKVEHQLMDVYYRWAIARLYSLRIDAVIPVVRLRRLGYSWPAIVATMVLRAAKRLLFAGRYRLLGAPNQS